MPRSPIIFLLLALLCCTLSLAQNACRPNPCKNGGTCSLLSPEAFSCNCLLTGFNGTTCSQQIYCPITTEGNAIWQQAKALTVSYGICQPGFIGKPSRVCQETGSFANINRPCLPENSTCFEDIFNNAVWPPTRVGQNATAKCLHGFSTVSGAQGSSRKCKNDGSWEGVALDHCLRNYCPEENSGGGVWPVTPSLSTVTFHCPTGLGVLNRTCGKDGVWDDVVGACGETSSVPCPSEIRSRALWTFTDPGKTAQGSCILGWAGSPTRICKHDGTWEDLVRNHCQRNSCPEEVSDGLVWRASASMVTVRVTCPGGTGSVERTCKANGTWAEVAGPCGEASSVPCVAQEYGGAFWAATDRGKTSFGECLSLSGGEISRWCGLDGKWIEPQGSCSL